MSRWFRFYDDVIHDAKILKLSDEMFRVWVTFLCLASKGEGRLPPPADIAATLRERPAKVAAWIAGLRAAGLLDEIDGAYLPHNWGGRQYKSDVSTERVKRFRKRKGNVSVTPPEAETDTEADNDDAGVARAPLVSKPANDLAEQLLVIAGHDPKFWPPGWCGAPMRVETWLAQGWKPEIITAAVRGAAARKKGAPAASVQFFENAIAEEVARQAAPLPTVQIRQAETFTVTHGTSQNRSGGSLISAIDRELAAIEAEERADLALSEGPVLRISN
jgi:hypothetical protein